MYFEITNLQGFSLWSAQKLDAAEIIAPWGAVAEITEKKLPIQFCFPMSAVLLTRG